MSEWNIQSSVPLLAVGVLPIYCDRLPIMLLYEECKLHWIRVRSNLSVMSANAQLLSDSYDDLSDSYGEGRTCFGVIPVIRLNCCDK